MVRPRIEHAPEAYGTFGPRVCDFADACGVVLDEWQRYVINGLFAVNEAGKWVASEFGLVVARQNGKGEILVVYDLAHLFMFPRVDNRRKTILHSAHEVKTAEDGFQRLSGVIESKGKLMDRLEVGRSNGIRIGNGVQGITLAKRKGQTNADRIKFIARTRSSGRGFPSDINVYDEAQEMSSHARDALTYTQTTAPNKQELFTGTAPGPENDAEVFEGVRDRGRAHSGKKTGWMEYTPEHSEDPRALLVHPRIPLGLIDESRPIIDLGSHKVWREANPAVNIRAFSFETIADEVERATDIESLARERFSWWPNRAEVVEEALNELDLEVWARHATEDAREFKPDSIAISVGRGGGYSTISIAARADLDTIVVKHASTQKGTRWVPAYVADLKDKHPDALVVLDPKNATATLTDLEGAKVKFMRMSLDEIMGAYSSFIELVNEGLVEHPPQKEVDASLKAATPRAIGKSGYTWDQSDPSKPVTHTQSATFAVWGVKKLESAPPKPPAVVRGYA